MQRAFHPDGSITAPPGDPLWVQRGRGEGRQRACAAQLGTGEGGLGGRLGGGPGRPPPGKTQFLDPHPTWTDQRPRPGCAGGESTR